MNIFNYYIYIAIIVILVNLVGANILHSSILLIKLILR